MYYVFDSQAEAEEAQSQISIIGGAPLPGTNCHGGVSVKGHTIKWANIRQRLDGKWVFKKVPPSILSDITEEKINQFNESFTYSLEEYSYDWFEHEE